MDNFAEQLVKKNLTASEKTRHTVTVIAGVVGTLIFILFGFIMLGRPVLSVLGFILAVGAGYGTFNTMQSSYVEYEYAFTNGELDIDKIIAKKKRKALISTDVTKFTAFGKYTDDIEEPENMTVVISSDNIASHEYYADFQHEDYGLTRLVFAPNEKILDNIKRYLPANVRAKLAREETN
ncbi:MAG: DUF6106 family protein [Prevotella sp.]|nr:DUF6106 family protein [Alistipes senegalensis]MCM1358172.1 DUF6106 family protein [Prevotella sp.]